MPRYQVLYALGSNGGGQLGIGRCEDVGAPHVCFVPKTVNVEHLPRASIDSDSDSSENGEPERKTVITKIVGGGNHTLALTTAGVVLWAGDPRRYACGPMPPGEETYWHPRPTFSPLQKPPPTKVVNIAATWEVSVLVADEGRKVYSFGTEWDGELGWTEETPMRRSLDARRACCTPCELVGFPPEGRRVVDIAGGLRHVVAVLDNGEAWGWGTTRWGQLGDIEADFRIVMSPKLIRGTGIHVKKVACGKDHTVLIGDDRVVVHGKDGKWGIHNRLPEDVEEFRPLKGVGSGWNNIYLLNTDGKLIGWGRNDLGQIPPTDLPPIEAMAVGSEHVVVLTKAGDVVAWGWNEHGNVGTPAVGDNNSKGAKEEAEIEGANIKETAPKEEKARQEEFDEGDVTLTDIQQDDIEKVTTKLASLPPHGIKGADVQEENTTQEHTERNDTMVEDTAQEDAEREDTMEVDTSLDDIDLWLAGIKEPTQDDTERGDDIKTAHPRLGPKGVHTRLGMKEVRNPALGGLRLPGTKGADVQGENFTQEDGERQDTTEEAADREDTMVEDTIEEHTTSSAQMAFSPGNLRKDSEDDIPGDAGQADNLPRETSFSTIPPSTLDVYTPGPRTPSPDIPWPTPVKLWNVHKFAVEPRPASSGPVVLASLKNLPEGAKISVLGAGCATTFFGIDLPLTLR